MRRKNSEKHKKVIMEEPFFASLFKVTFYWCKFSQFFLQIWSENSALFGTHNYLFEKTSFFVLFCGKYKVLSSLPVWFCFCGGRVDGTLLLKCYTLCPICLT